MEFHIAPMSSPSTGHAPPPHGTPLAPEQQALAALRQALAGAYEVERPLGQGGMGSVCLGRDVTLDRPVAIEVITGKLAASSAPHLAFVAWRKDADPALQAQLREAHAGLARLRDAGTATPVR